MPTIIAGTQGTGNIQQARRKVSMGLIPRRKKKFKSLRNFIVRKKK